MSNIAPRFDPHKKLVTEIFEAIERHVEGGLNNFEVLGILDIIRHTLIDSTSDDDDGDDGDDIE